jgi:protein SCO1
MKKLFICALFVLTAGLMAIGLPGCNSFEKKPGKESKVNTNQGIDAESLYQTGGKWDNQYGDTIRLSNLTGKIPVVSMVFTRCTFACPRIVADMRKIEKQVPKDKKDKVVFVLISFDTERDHTKELKDFAKQMNLGENWLVLHGNSEAVRELSMLLDVKYKRQPNGDFTHSSGITLLDTNGAIATKVEGLGTDPKALVDRIKTM